MAELRLPRLVVLRAPVDNRPPQGWDWGWWQLVARTRKWGLTIINNFVLKILISLILRAKSRIKLNMPKLKV